ncbi:hypothetical protein D3C81_1536560 [compost metagenome]
MMIAPMAAAISRNGHVAATAATAKAPSAIATVMAIAWVASRPSTIPSIGPMNFMISSSTKPTAVPNISKPLATPSTTCVTALEMNSLFEPIQSVNESSASAMPGSSPTEIDLPRASTTDRAFLSEDWNFAAFSLAVVSKTIPSFWASPRRADRPLPPCCRTFSALVLRPS